MLELTDLLLEKRRYIVAGTSATIILFICLVAPMVEAYCTRNANNVKTLSDQSSQTTYEGSDIATDGISQLGSATGHIANTVESKTFNGVMATATSVTNFDKYTVTVAQDAVVIPAQTVANSTTNTGHVIGDVINLVSDTSVSFFGLFHGFSHISSIIQPKNPATIPTITQLRAQQAALIQSDTTAVSVAASAVGTGGACDNGSGNGGYPTSWCNSSMDSVATVSYSNDPINRECTSYAYWYFTSVEGYSDFRVLGNAKSWAFNSNYPVHRSPAVGAIAVETAGAYGHVAIVQALPGQNYAGQTVPIGYVLVSEMNYDWNGHFRYSYRPLSKFSAYIYP